jgi:sulfonate transport system permease protein
MSALHAHSTARDVDASPDGHRPQDAVQYRDLSRSASTIESRGGWRRRRIWRRGLRVAVPIALLVFWEVGSVSGFISSKFLDSPATVASAFGNLVSTGQLQSALAVSLRRAGIGLAFGLAIGVSFGLITGLSRLGEELFDSSLQMFRMIPFLAVIPLLILWFGLGETAKEILIAVACIYPSYINTYAGVRSIDPKLIEASRVFGLRGPRLIRTVVLPNAMPGILIGLRYAMGVSILALIAAEEINANSGLGYLAETAQNAFRNDIIIVLVLVYAVLGLLIDFFVRLLERVLLPWRPSVVGS